MNARLTRRVSFSLLGQAAVGTLVTLLVAGCATQPDGDTISQNSLRLDGIRTNHATAEVPAAGTRNALLSDSLRHSLAEMKVPPMTAGTTDRYAMTPCVATVGQPTRRAHPTCAVPGKQASIAQQLADLADSSSLASNDDDDDDAATVAGDGIDRDGALSHAAPITASIPDTSNFHQTGNASWYGTRFHGRKTASGERYDMHEFTAAHRSLPLMSYVRVINTQNHRAVIVKINDRGPFSGHRVLDLSSAAAKALGMHDRGTQRVEIVGMSPSEARAAMAQPMLASN